MCIDDRVVEGLIRHLEERAIARIEGVGRFGGDGKGASVQRVSTPEDARSVPAHGDSSRVVCLDARCRKMIDGRSGRRDMDRCQGKEGRPWGTELDHAIVA